MKRSKALVIVTRQLRHVCPYLGQEKPLALCYIKSQDVAEREFCYGCDHVEKLKEKFGLRTFKRQIVLSACRHCYEAASLHDEQGKSLRVTRCPGFEPVQDEGIVYVPTNLSCTEWMVVNVATGERRAYVDHRGGWDGELNARRFHLPLLGAPGTVPSDLQDELRIEAAAYAEKRRRGYGSRLDDEGETKTVKIRKPRQKKT